MIRLLLLTFIFLTILPAVSFARDEVCINTNKWATLPILHEGRVKPLDSFARLILKSFSEQESVGKLNASEWLAFSVFDPAEAAILPIFKIREAKRHGLEDRTSRLYSYEELTGVIQRNQKVIKDLIGKDESSWSVDQLNLINHYEHYILYTQILRSLSLILPINAGDTKSNFLDYKKRQEELVKETKIIVDKKGVDLEKYTDEERNIAFLSHQLNVMEMSAQNNVLFKIIPENWTLKDTNWVSPWEIIQEGKGSPKSAEYIDIWQNLAEAYRTGNIQNWDLSVISAKSYFVNPKLKIEKYYNVLNLLNISLILYAFSFLILITNNILKENKFNSTLQKTALGFLCVGAVAHFIHMALRVYILERPPVGTLYESILFVCLICVLGFIYLHKKQRSDIGILLGSLSGLILLTTAKGFMSEDSMGTLVAVLNTNFWLGTHVLCITVGYGTCLIASLMAHYDLVIRWLKPANNQLFIQSYKNLKTMIILSLLFTTIGTILGGIWADQSWGRFWGWDPKENGALLIVLWLAWLLHGRISEHINEIGFVMGSAFLSVIVVLAWFGVNLLNVGLHSYGFISGIAAGIAVFSILEAVLIGGLWFKTHQKRTVYEN